MTMNLFEEDSPRDLYGRGFPRRDIVAAHGAVLGRIPREVSRSVDVAEYQRAHVAQRLDEAGVRAAIEGYASRGDRDELYAALGLRHSGRAATVGSLVEPFGLAQEWERVRHATRIARGRRTCEARYGAPSLFERPGGQDVARAGVRAKYGVDNVFASDEVKAKIRARSLERHGVEFVSQRADVQAKIVATNLERFGVPRPNQNPDVMASVMATKARRGTFHTSSSEERLYEALVEVFGADDVVRQYRDDDRYPFTCDFYVRSRDMFVELNGTWAHGGRWYDPSCAAHVATVEVWRSKSTKYYDHAVRVWTVTDVAKRAAAREHGLNYVVLWDHRLDDAMLWVAMGCPDGEDWGREHSWLPDRSVAAPGPSSWPDEVSVRPRLAVRAAKVANGEVFYAREMAAWSSDKQKGAWGTIRSRLFANRYKYLGKTPHELTDREILSGLSISGEIRAYTVFSNEGMVDVLRRYRATSVYDPCAGWGERLFTCAGMGLPYLGTDVDGRVVAGHGRMVARYGLTAQTTQVGDAATTDVRERDHDVVFTCPPYGGVEVYTEHGAENLDDEAFAAWWGRVVEMSTGGRTRVFAYQVNQKMKDVMNAELTARGWSLVEQLPVGVKAVSHFHRRAGGTTTKREYEEVQVFTREIMNIDDEDGELE